MHLNNTSSYESVSNTSLFLWVVAQCYQGPNPAFSLKPWITCGAVNMILDISRMRPKALHWPSTTGSLDGSGLAGGWAGCPCNTRVPWWRDSSPSCAWVGTGQLCHGHWGPEKGSKRWVERGEDTPRWSQKRGGRSLGTNKTLLLGKTSGWW